MDRGIVKLVVEDRSPPIFYRVFDGRYHENDNEGHCVQRWVRGAENGEDLKGGVSVGAESEEAEEDIRPG